ncbi:hypothetical protein L914_03925 [Phytophthora nicotianae]|uniref:Uncharacterized protein n=1 Tax=Phytophthora nicotianae TaxID=4792 RepID=W2NUT7_PHYNI|nr:hypothetical protein L914_03925 [Phytophthora nicotianae]
MYIVKVICEKTNPELSLPWAIERCKLEVVKQMHHHHRHGAGMWEFLQAMIAAISSGKFEMVKFLNETCGEELYRWLPTDKSDRVRPDENCEVSVPKRIQSHFL